MRIISQSGISIDFDSVMVKLSDSSILAYFPPSTNILLGKYGSDDEALGVFMDIHKQWEQDIMSVYEMPVK